MIGRTTSALVELLVHGQLAAMEPAGDRPDDLDTGGPLLAGRTAAMEPAGDRPDDMNTWPLLPWPVVPQWSRPVIGRTTSPSWRAG